MAAAELNQKLLEDLLVVQMKAEEKMLAKVAKRVKKGITTEGWNEQKLNDMQLLRQDILKTLNNKNKIDKSYIQKAIIKAYESGGNNVSKALLKKPTTLMNDMIPLHLQHLILEMNNAVAGTSFQIVRNVDDVYRGIMNETTTGLLVGVDTRQQAAQQALNDFAHKGISGFTDKIGRKWELASYVEMATRTISARAALQGHVDRSLELDQDLMLVSGHAATCPICAPWGNQVISISGKTPGYPTLETAKAAGLFHPNCKHTMTVWFPELEGNQEHLEQYTQEPDPEKYEAIQKQRYNERKIREWKRVEAVAMDPVSKQKANSKVLQWQAVQREHVNQYNLRRKYTRESIQNRIGDPTKASVKPDISKIYKPKVKMEDTTVGQINILEKGYITFDNIDNFKVQGFSNNQIISNPILKVFNDKLGSATNLKDLQDISKDLLDKVDLLTNDIKAYDKAKSWIEQINKQTGDKIDFKKTESKPIPKPDPKPIKKDPPVTRTYNINEVRTKTKEEIDAMLIKQSTDYNIVEKRWIKQSEDWAETIPKSHVTAVKRYTGSSYADMNEHMRGMRTGDSTTIKRVEDCIKALSKNKIEEEMVVRRGVSYTGFAGMFDERDIAKSIGGESWIEEKLDKLIGRVGNDKGFLSTSPHQNGGFSRNVNLKINLPAGTEGVYVDAISSNKGEREFLIQKGYNYIVTDVEKHEGRGEMGSRYTIYMSVIPES